MLLGHSLYGGYVDGCKSFYGLYTGSTAAFRKIFHYGKWNPSEVSSNLVGVCFCSLTSSKTLECYISSSTFLDNKAICAFQTNVIFRGNKKSTVVVLVHCSWTHTCILNFSTNQLFVNNLAPSVGAQQKQKCEVHTKNQWSIDGSSMGLTPPCFFQVPAEGQKILVSMMVS